MISLGSPGTSWDIDPASWVTEPYVYGPTWRKNRTTVWHPCTVVCPHIVVIMLADRVSFSFYCIRSTSNARRLEQKTKTGPPTQHSAPGFGVSRYDARNKCVSPGWQPNSCGKQKVQPCKCETPARGENWPLLSTTLNSHPGTHTCCGHHIEAPRILKDTHQGTQQSNYRAQVFKTVGGGQSIFTEGHHTSKSWPPAVPGQPRSLFHWVGRTKTPQRGTKNLSNTTLKPT